ncbi:hypothetical protein M9Y10_000840 [Tritrichomonas musculus]|uniref:ABC transporter domain-containing protein n=1 Tax=Tritrichomonas musculus TaxID=1915356 RepID=A0ABR2L666_9EUKA
MAKSNVKFCPLNHYVAILYRRVIMYKRSVKSLITTAIGLILFSALGIAVQYLMIELMKPKDKPVNFDSYRQIKDDFVFVGEYNEDLSKRIINHLENQYKDDTGNEAGVEYFDSIDKMNSELYQRQVDGKYNLEIPFAIDFKNVKSAPYLFSLIYNQTTNAELEDTDSLRTNAHILFGNTLWNLEFGDKSIFSVSIMKLQLKLAQLLFSLIGPMLIVCGLMTIISLVITQPVADIRGEARQYMIQCSLKLTPYWLATFTVDIIVWIILCTIVWGIYCMGQVRTFLDNMLTSWYLMVFTGPSFIFFLYDFSFLFKDSNSAARQTFLILICLIILPMLVTVIAESDSVGLNWFYSIFPNLLVMQALGAILMNTGSRKHSLSYYWKEKLTFPFFIMQFIDIVIYAGILIIIEMFRLKIQRKLAKKSYNSYTDFLRQLKAKHHNSDETLQMEQEVHNSHDFAVRVENVSRLFINTAGEPIAAVNCVSLGVKEGSIFGFLGANGAGKTTLIRMITGSLPCSDGSIEIFNTPVEEIKDSTILSICPQFNNHLCFEMTPREHFKLFALLYEMDTDEGNQITEYLMSGMDLIDFIDKPIRDLSAGDVRKLAIALTFFGPSKIVLLDEPTASLDPVACKCVHEMILENRGEKTFMLCTHLLSEAEELCDNISIMVKGNVFTVGSPQYLTKKFGTEYKIDVMLKDDDDQTVQKCDAFFAEKMPYATLSMKRPKSRIYSVPADAVTLAELFSKMQEGQDSNIGITYYTCSSSSLERVFMEIVQISETENEDGALQNLDKGAKEKDLFEENYYNSDTSGKEKKDKEEKKKTRKSSDFNVSKLSSDEYQSNTSNVVNDTVADVEKP